MDYTYDNVTVSNDNVIGCCALLSGYCGFASSLMAGAPVMCVVYMLGPGPLVFFLDLQSSCRGRVGQFLCFNCIFLMRVVFVFVCALLLFSQIGLSMICACAYFVILTRLC